MAGFAGNAAAFAIIAAAGCTAAVTIRTITLLALTAAAACTLITGAAGARIEGETGIIMAMTGAEIRPRYGPQNAISAAAIRAACTVCAGGAAIAVLGIHLGMAMVVAAACAAARTMFMGTSHRKNSFLGEAPASRGTLHPMIKSEFRFPKTSIRNPTLESMGPDFAGMQIS